MCQKKKKDYKEKNGKEWRILTQNFRINFSKTLRGSFVSDMLLDKKKKANISFTLWSNKKTNAYCIGKLQAVLQEH